eukprot:2364543-Karenia_brevis.AAC.1
MGQKVFASLYSSHPDPSILQSFADLFNIAAIESGIQGVSFSPVVPQGQDQAAGASASTDAGSGGNKRDSSPTPLEQAPRSKEPKKDSPP